MPTVALISIFFVLIAGMVVRAQVLRPMTGVDGLVGETGVVKQIDGLEGKVVVHGELWRAEFTQPASVGEKVAVQAVNQLVVKVGPVDGNIA